MNDARPLVTVVVPTYNRAATICVAIHSALAQDYRPLEIVVVDDGSQDDTLERLGEFGAAIRVVRHERNRGASAARNTGIEAASGEYIAFLDSDDSWQPRKTSRQMQFMLQHGFVMSCTGFSSIYEQGGAPILKMRPYGTRITLKDAVWGVYVAPGTTLIAGRELLRKIGGYDTTLPRLEDWELLLKALVETRELGFLNESLGMLQPANAYSVPMLESAARMLIERGERLLAQEEAGLARKFRAGIAFELAATSWKSGQKGKSLRWLFKSLVAAPVGNQSIRIILLPWLKDRLLGARG